MLHLLYLPLLTLILLFYFKIADRFNIIDKPNHRSSHNSITIRGGGIIVPIALLIHFWVTRFVYPYFTLGLFIISIVSFIDDVKPLSNKIRIIGQLAAVSLIFIETDLFSYPFWILLIGYVVIIGTINAYNFMDGINGITGGYSLVVVASLWYVNRSVSFVDNSWLLITLIALVVFTYFNFRQKAMCFAGDIGSVSVAFIILSFLLILIINTGQFKYFGFLLLYGLDSISTIVFRLIRRENIFVAHRTHFYQKLANNMHWPHLSVAGLYIAVQLFLNLIIIAIDMDSIQFLIFCTALGFLFIGVRLTVEGKEELLGKGVDSFKV